MQKRHILSLTAAVALTGCAAFETSPTWRTVVENRATPGVDYSGKEEYVDRLHTVLAAQQVEHKIVTYQYRYRTRLREEAVNTASAVVYRDPGTPGYPWWLMDEHLGFPVWLPNEDINRQVSFYIRRKAEVLEAEDFSGGSDHKSVARLSAPAPRFRVASIPARQPKRPVFAQTNRTEVQPKSTPAPTYRTVQPRAGTSAAPVSSRLFPSRLAVNENLPSRVQSNPALSEPRYAALFRTRNGTRFDPASKTDREKMEVLRQKFFTRHATAQLR